MNPKIKEERIEVKNNCENTKVKNNNNKIKIIPDVISDNSR